ncbi:FHA domain containing protein [[Leptolyngbya] sp. PCC 7376]|nr:FHA domain containing protein [[Leptolyngbya] sp. PCC 7376]
MQNLGKVQQISTGGVSVGLLADVQLIPNQDIVFGREPSCQIALDPNRYTVVSRRHAVLRQTPAGWEVVDLGSANGTFVNGQQISSYTLQSGDRLMLGDNGPEFLFELTPSSQAETVAANFQPTSSSPAPIPVPSPNAKNADTNVTLSQLFPIAGSGKDLSHKGYLIPGILTVVCVVLMFASIGEPVLFNLLLSTYIAGAAFYYIYQLCGKRKSWWVLIGSALLTMLMLVTPVISLFIFVFRDILPGGLYEDGGIIALFIGMFFGAGLMEEILKALPVFLAMFIGNKFKSLKRRQKIGVNEPLDGILLGTASAVGFTLLETLGQYVPNIISEVSMNVDASTGELLGLQLLIPRILGSVAGHMAYSGYFGYFIGLSVLKPSKRWTILIVGCLTSSLLHALWNTVGSYSSLLLAVVGVFSYAFLAAAILKARALSPTRSENFATRIAP